MVLKEASQQTSEKSSHSQSLLSAIPPRISSLRFPPYQIYQPYNPCTTIKTDKNLILFPQCKWHCEILSRCKILRKGDSKSAVVHLYKQNTSLYVTMKMNGKDFHTIIRTSGEWGWRKEAGWSPQKRKIIKLFVHPRGASTLKEQVELDNLRGKKAEKSFLIFPSLLKPLYSIIYPFLLILTP